MQPKQLGALTEICSNRSKSQSDDVSAAKNLVLSFEILKTESVRTAFSPSKRQTDPAARFSVRIVDSIQRSRST